MTVVCGARCTTYYCQSSVCKQGRAHTTRATVHNLRYQNINKRLARASPPQPAEVRLDEIGTSLVPAGLSITANCLSPTVQFKLHVSDFGFLERRGR